jgi:hypothetical protein
MSENRGFDLKGNIVAQTRVGCGSAASIFKPRAGQREAECLSLVLKAGRYVNCVWPGIATGGTGNLPQVN